MPKAVRVKIVETFTKEVEVHVPKGVKSDADVLMWVRTHVDSRVLDATKMDGAVDPASDMDYKQEMTLCQS